MTFEAVTTTAALPTPNTEVAFGSLSNAHNYFDAYIDFLTNVGQQVKVLIYATSGAAGVRALVAQSDWLTASPTPVRCIAGLQFITGTLFEIQVVSLSVCANVKASLVGYEAQQNFVPQDVSTATTALVAGTDTVMATITNPHSYFDASAEYIAIQGVPVRWSLYATAGTSGVRAKVAQVDMPAAISANQKVVILGSLGPIGANTIELSAYPLSSPGATPNIKASLNGFDPISISNTTNSITSARMDGIGAFVNQSLVAYDILATNNNGVALVQGNQVLLIRQTTLSQNGPWVVGLVTANTAPLTRPSWWASGMAMPAVQEVVVGATGNNFQFSKFRIYAFVPGQAVDTGSVICYPQNMKGTGALVAGTLVVNLFGPVLSGTGGSKPSVINVTNPVALKAVLNTGANPPTLTVTDSLGGADSFDWIVTNW